MNTVEIFEFVVVYLIPILLFGAALYQLGKSSGHWAQNVFQGVVYLVFSSLYLLMVMGILEIPRMIYFIVVGFAFVFSLVLELLFIKSGSNDTGNKIIAGLMILHLVAFLFFNILVAWS
jgi:hypothetical protein